MPRQIIKVYPKEMKASKSTGFQNYPVDFRPAQNGRLQYQIATGGALQIRFSYVEKLTNL